MIVERQRYDKPYYPSKETVRFFLWFNSFFKEDNKSAEAHYQLIDHINKRYKYKGIECHRGLAKSTLVGIYQMIYWAFLGKKPGLGEVDYVLYIMDTVSQVASAFEQIIMILEENTELAKHLEVKKSKLGDDPTIYIYNKDLKKTIYFKGRGSGQKIRGTRIAGKRPNVVILDDIENDENVESNDSREKLRNWFFNAVLPAVNPNRFEIIFIGTPLHQDALLINLLESDSWYFIQIPVAEELTEDMILDQHKAKNIISSWSDRFTPSYIRETYLMYKNTNRITGFWQEMMLQITPKENMLFDMSKLRSYSTTDMKDTLNTLTYYISVDLAISEKSSADYTVIAVIGVSENNDWFLVDGFYGRIKPDETINKIFEYVTIYKPYEVILEKVAFQASMKTFIEKEMLARGRFFNLNMITRPTHKNSKLSVIKGLQPIIELGKLWLPDDYIGSFVAELKNEMMMITNEKILAKHDDLIDAVSQLTLVNILTVNSISHNYVDSLTRKSTKNSYIF
jgi:predicted phage terminase large subunit-like protein